MVFLADSLFPSPEGATTMTTKAMSPLRQRMLEDMQLRGLSARTEEAYTGAVWQFPGSLTTQWCGALCVTP